jgi:EAL domain-containing protein (putative c-di-GMP-specific phosphodiesterase class I)/GGDEF domain-containing protein
MGGGEQRRYPRLSTRQPVTVRAAGLVLHGEIRDYCGAGLFLDFADAPPPDAVAAFGMSSRVQLDFSREQAGILRHHRLQARVARSLPTGLGLQVTEMPADVLQALEASGAAAVRSGGVPDAGTAVGADARKAMRERCNARFGDFLERMLTEFFDQSAADLTNAADQAVGTLQRAHLSGAARDLAGKRSLLLKAFGRSIREALRHPGRGVAATAEGTPATLSLVDDDQFEDWLNLSTVARRVEGDQSLALIDLYRRYGALRDLPIDRSNCPFGPEVICRAFQDALYGLDQTMAVRAVAYRTFGVALARHCPTLYMQLDAVLAPMDAVAPPPGREPRAAGSAASRQAPEERSPDGSPDTGDASIAEILATVRRLQSDREADAELAKPAPGAVMAGDARTVAAASPQRLLRLLDQLVYASASAPVGAGRGDRAPASDGQPAPPAREAPDSAGGLLDRALRESASVPEIRDLLGRLEGPLRELALRDADFLESAEHPARRTVDLIDQYAMATDASGRLTDPHLRRFLDRLVDRIAGHTDGDPALFELAQRHLARLLVPVRQARGRRVAELQAVCEARDGVRRAGRRVDEVLALRFGGQPVPALVSDLLEAGLRQHLTMLALRVGQGHATWRKSLSELDRLSVWLQPGYAPGPGFPLEAAESAAWVVHALSTSNMDGERVTGAVGELHRVLEAVGAGAGGAFAAATADGGTDSESRSDAAAGPGADEHGEADREASALRPGSWWLVTREGEPVPMQLVWVSACAEHCALTTRSATRKLELPAADFARALDAGRIAPWSDQDRPLIERSAFSLLDEGRLALREQTIRDPVSGQLSRKGFQQHLQRIARRVGGGSHIVGILEFDQLRMIYGACGMDAAQRLVRRLADELRNCLGPEAVMAALRDDTLAVLLPGVGLDAGRDAIEATMLRLADWRFQHGEQRYSIGLNVGMSVYSPGVISPEEAVSRSDAACVASKVQGRNRMQVYEPGSAQVKDHESLVDWAGRIDGMLEGDGLSLRCQMVMPIGLDAASLPYYEILLGIETADGPAASPTGFVLAIERLKRSHELDLWMLRQVLAWIAAHRDDFDAIGGFAINVSPLSLSDPGILAFLHDQLARPEVPADKLAFEITETAAIESYGAAQDFIRQIRPYGCRFALDDFGSGYTSYAHLKNLNTDSLKIDGSFVRDIATSARDYAMVKSMHEVARSLGMRTVAEYVETPLILAKLREIGVDYAQGYAIHKPCPIGELTDRGVRA